MVNYYKKTVSFLRIEFFNLILSVDESLKILISIFVFKDRIRNISDIIISSNDGADGLSIQRIRFGYIMAISPFINEISIKLMDLFIAVTVFFNKAIDISRIDTSDLQSKISVKTVWITGILSHSI